MTKKVFSIIIAAYNVDKYLEEAIKSVIKQRFDFNKVEIILIDDGSADKTPEICDKYREKYPKNIKVIHQKNAGVAAARNAGLRFAEGAFINFLDSDDKLSSNTLTEIKKFYDIHKEKTDVVTIPLYFFGDEKGEHLLNDKFKSGTRLVDLTEEPDIKLLSTSASFIRKEAIRDKKFDIKLRFAEDAKLLQEIFSNKPTLGLVSSAKYMYRRRGDGGSTIQSSKENKAWYQDYLDYFQLDTINAALNKFGSVPKFTQNVLAYDLQWRIEQSKIPVNLLTESEIEKYHKTIFKIYEYIDDDVIMAQKNMLVERKVMILSKKHGKLPELKSINNEVVYAYDDTVCLEAELEMLTIDFVTIEKNKIILEGWIPHNPSMEKEILPLKLDVNGEIFDPVLIEKREEKNPETCMNILVFNKLNFRFEVPLNPQHKYELRFKRDSKFGLIDAKIVFWERFAPITEKLLNSYYYDENWLIQYKYGKIHLSKPRFIAFRELRLLLELWKRHEKVAVGTRIIYRILRPFYKKPIWILSDRVAKADDNGEVLFRYLQKKQPKNIKTYFAIGANTDDYERLKDIGPILKSYSRYHKFVFLLCNYNISSSGDAETIRPFGNHSYCYGDILYNKRFVFLQHGVIKDDLSSWLNRYSGNFYGFVTTATPEYESIINTKTYYYDEKQVWQTGLPRFDRLENKPENIITVAPTWRRWIFDDLNGETGIWELKNGFLESDFYNFYNNLLNHPRLLKVLKNYGYKLNFMPHPNLMPYIDQFKKNDKVIFSNVNTSYQDVFAKSKLILTDYSSVVFDFIYLNKPVIYCQFDKQRYLDGEHSYEPGYFDYERDGFGEVEYDLESTVDRLIEYIKNDCEMRKKYERRVDSFFAFRDKKNCERVYKKLIEHKN